MTMQNNGTIFRERGTVTIKTTRFVRKPFYVDAVQVTAENISDVAKWCQGSVMSTFQKGKADSVDYVQVRVLRPLNVRQTMAFVGDWILYAGTGYKVYSQKAFAKSFDPVDTEAYPETLFEGVVALDGLTSPYESSKPNVHVNKVRIPGSTLSGL